jgi:endonuclease/exonuclease/phosphatase family metal-dependent hydrolase
MVPRTLGETVIDMDGTPVTVFVAHLALRDTLRHTQISEIADIVQRVEGPVILGGDFNERTQTAFEVLHTTGLKHFCGLPNFPSWKPRHTLEVAFLSEHFEVEKHYVPTQAQFSDHLPLLVEASLQTP